jgi:glycosyltransferase involved in cell wall biosynthesis
MPKERMGIVATRLGGLDGVSLEVDKWVKVLKKMERQIFLCAGEITNNPYGYNQVSGRGYPELAKTTIIPELNINHKDNKRLSKIAFGNREVNQEKFKQAVNQLAKKIEDDLIRWLQKNQIQKIIVENINCLPAHLPAAVAISNILEKNPALFALFHHHDFYWERDGYRKNSKNARFYFEKYFPPKAKNALHVVINSNAQRDLLKRRRIRSFIIPNVFDQSIARKDTYNRSFRKDIGLSEDDLFFLVPARIVPRKNIETAIQLIKVLDNPKIKLIIAGCLDLDFEGDGYLKKLKKLTSPIKERVKFICDYIAPRRQVIGSKKIYTIFDVYAYADFVLYPTLYEGWGNALGEALIAQVPVLVNRYKIFKEDIEPLGFEMVKINNGKISKRAVEKVMEILNNKELRKKMVKKNYFLIKKYCGLEILEKRLNDLL